MTGNGKSAESACAELRAFLSDEIVCEVMADGTDRIGCLTPIEYPDGDSVVVWVDRRADAAIEVSDYGEGLSGKPSVRTESRKPCPTWPKGSQINSA